MSRTVLIPSDAGVTDDEQRQLSELGYQPMVYDQSTVPTSSEAAQAEVLILPFFPQLERVSELLGLPRLRMVQTLTAGYEGLPDLLTEGQLLANARGAHGGATAEWAMAALLAVVRELPSMWSDQQQRQWRPRTTGTLLGSRVLVLGAGDLGTNMARRLEPFGASTTVVASRARDGVHGFDELPGLLADQDAVVVMVPLTEHTSGMVDAQFLARMPEGAVLVNAARGPVVDTAALLEELQSGRLRAALDVTDPEPLPPEHPLWSAPGTLITPHVAGAQAGGRDRAMAVALDQLESFVRGEEPPNVVARG